MSAYTKADIYLDDMKDLLDTYWVEYAELPKPQLKVTNDPLDSHNIRVNLQDGDAIIIRSDSPEQIKPRGNYIYFDRIVSVSLEMLTMKDRQRLYDMWRQVRVICWNQKHDFPNYQLIKIGSWQEYTNEEENLWRGIARISLENNAILAETA